MIVVPSGFESARERSLQGVVSDSDRRVIVSSFTVSARANS